MTMINKENMKEAPKKDKKYVDTAHMDVQAHILIKDKDSKKVLVNKRG